MENKDKEILFLRQRNIDLQTKILDKMDEYGKYNNNN